MIFQVVAARPLARAGSAQKLSFRSRESPHAEPPERWCLATGAGPGNDRGRYQRPGGPEGGLYSRAQSYFILKDFFDVTRTEEFSFVSIHEPDDQPHTAIGRAERTFRRRDSSRLLQDRIFVSLVQESDRWVVAEIKSLR